MNRETSVYLNLVRFMSALVVMVSHLSDSSSTGGFGWQFRPFGNPAVDIFLVLSGFVIAFATTEKERDLITYARNRAARIYSVAIPALLVTALLGVIGYAARPDFPWHLGSPFDYMRSLLFINQIWFSQVIPGNDGPYWSLGYIVWYYIIFGAAIFFRGRMRYGLAVVFLALAGPKIALMFPIWLIGVAAYKFIQRHQISRVVALVLWGGSGLVLAALAFVELRHAQTCHYDCYLSFPVTRPLDDWQEYLTDYSIAVLVALNFVGFYFSSGVWGTFTALIRRPVNWLAGATISIYLFHNPVSLFLVAMSPWELGTSAEIAFVWLGTLAFIFAIAQVTERKKHLCRDVIQRMVELYARLQPTSSR